MTKSVMFRSALAVLVLAVGGLAVQAHKASPPPPSATMTIDCAAVLKAKVNINTAQEGSLLCLKGVGPKIAADIVKNRPYKDGKDVQTKVKGIGPKTWDDMKAFVIFK
jgi:competence protein ComEA